MGDRGDEKRGLCLKAARAKAEPEGWGIPNIGLTSHSSCTTPVPWQNELAFGVQMGVCQGSQ